MSDSCDRAVAAVADVGRGSSDRARGGEPAEKPGTEVRDALSDELLVGVVLRAEHAVGDGRREQRFDGAQQRDRDRRLQQLLEAGEREMRQRERRQPARDAAERGADRRDAVGMGEGDEQGRGQERDHRRGDLADDRDSRPESDDQQACEAEHRGRRLDVRERRQQLRQLLEERGTGRGGKPEEVPPLAHEDDDRDARREPENDGLRDEADDAAELGQAEKQQHRPGQQRHDLEPGQAMSGGDAEEQHGEGAGRAGDLDAGSTEERDQQSGDERRVESLLGLGAGGDRERHGQRQRDDADDDAG